VKHNTWFGRARPQSRLSSFTALPVDVTPRISAQTCSFKSQMTRIVVPSAVTCVDLAFLTRQTATSRRACTTSRALARRSRGLQLPRVYKATCPSCASLTVQRALQASPEKSRTLDARLRACPRPALPHLSTPAFPLLIQFAFACEAPAPSAHVFLPSV
jgi:hypothetical protein